MVIAQWSQVHFGIEALRAVRRCAVDQRMQRRRLSGDDAQHAIEVPSAGEDIAGVRDDGAARNNRSQPEAKTNRPVLGTKDRARDDDHQHERRRLAHILQIEAGVPLHDQDKRQHERRQQDVGGGGAPLPDAR